MDHTELLRKIKSDLPGEISGIKEYAALAKMAEDADMECWEAMLEQMAWEEYTHAKHIMHILDKHNISYTEFSPAFKEAEKMLRNL